MVLRVRRSCDTFSFALVFLSLAVGDIRYVRTWAARCDPKYYTGNRPPIPAELKTRCPGIVLLIERMWSHDLRQRPAMKDVVTELEACKSLGDFDTASRSA